MGIEILVRSFSICLYTYIAIISLTDLYKIGLQHKEIQKEKPRQDRTSNLKIVLLRIMAFELSKIC